MVDDNNVGVGGDPGIRAGQAVELVMAAIDLQANQITELEALLEPAMVAEDSVCGIPRTELAAPCAALTENILEIGYRISNNSERLKRICRRLNL